MSGGSENHLSGLIVFSFVRWNRHGRQSNDDHDGIIMTWQPKLIPTRSLVGGDMKGGSELASHRT